MVVELKTSHNKLESRVVERTKQLSDAKIELEKTYNNLQGAHTKLEQSTQMLLQAEQKATLGIFAGGVAHEINNPLMAIINYIQYCLKHTDQNAKVYKVLQDAENESKRCER